MCTRSVSHLWSSSDMGIMLSIVLALALFATAQSAVIRHNKPVGLKNIGSSCFISSLVQNFHGIPTLRDRAYKDSDDNLALGLAYVFARLQQAPTKQYLEDEYGKPSYEGAVSIDGDFYPAYIKNPARKALGLREYASDDPNTFLFWLCGQLPWLESEFFGITTTVNLYFKGIQLPSVRQETNVSLQVHPEADGRKNLQELIDNLTSTSDDYRIKLTQDKNLNAKLEEAGVKWYSQNEIMHVHNILKTGPILPIRIVRTTTNGEETKTTLTYNRQLTVKNEIYSLHGMVIGKPNHFKAVVRTNVRSHWHEFDDSKVTRVTEEKALLYGDEVVMLFYVKDSEFAKWLRPEFLKVPIPEHIKRLAQQDEKKTGGHPRSESGKPKTERSYSRPGSGKPNTGGYPRPGSRKPKTKGHPRPGTGKPESPIANNLAQAVGRALTQLAEKFGKNLQQKGRIPQAQHPKGQ